MYESVIFKQVVYWFTGMAPSPSSSLNTPGPTVPTPSPCSLQEDQAYREKVRQLSKYIEPLRRMINRMGNDGM
jgi:mediator of RNA polymerase II transcription subunit 15